MSNKEFETKVLSALGTLNNRFDGLEWRFDGLEWKFNWLEKEMHKWFFDLNKKIDDNSDRLENLIIDESSEIRKTVNMNWKYINQAFDVISSMQNEKTQNKNYVS